MLNFINLTIVKGTDLFKHSFKPQYSYYQYNLVLVYYVTKF